MQDSDAPITPTVVRSHPTTVDRCMADQKPAGIKQVGREELRQPCSSDPYGRSVVDREGLHAHWKPRLPLRRVWDPMLARGWTLIIFSEKMPSTPSFLHRRGGACATFGTWVEKWGEMKYLGEVEVPNCFS